MECCGTTDFDNNSRLITLSAIIINGLHYIYIYIFAVTVCLFGELLGHTLLRTDMLETVVNWFRESRICLLNLNFYSFIDFAFRIAEEDVDFE